MMKARSKADPSIFETVDEFVGAIPWTRRRMVLVYLRHHGARSFVRMRTFNKHRVKGCWYPSPRFYVVPLECAKSLARAIESAASGAPFGEEPEWYRDFEKQYNAREFSRTDESETD